MAYSTCLGTDWGRVTWTVTGLTANCTILAEVRAADNPLKFTSTWRTVRAGENFCGKGVTGRYAQVRITIRRPTGANRLPLCNPRLSSLKIECCDQVGSQPVIDLPAEVTLVDGTRVYIAGEVSIKVPVLGSASAQAFWSVDGGVEVPSTFNATDTTASGWVHIPVRFVSSLSAGTHELSLRVVSGDSESTAITTVVIGDQAPYLEVKEVYEEAAFRGTMPGITPRCRPEGPHWCYAVSDDVTTGSFISLAQVPAAGTEVGQGSYPVTITATDSAGHSTSQRTTYTVLPVLKISEPASYLVQPVGQAVRVNAELAIAPALISRYRISFTSKTGTQNFETTTLPYTVNGGLPAGEYTMQITAINPAGLTSVSEPQFILVTPLLTASPVKISVADGITPAVKLHFLAPKGSTCVVQKSPDLIHWTNIYTIRGTGAEEDAIFPKGTEARAYYRVSMTTGG
jgi:fibronectin type 3 domain-containing protein